MSSKKKAPSSPADPPLPLTGLPWPGPHPNLVRPLAAAQAAGQARRGSHHLRLRAAVREEWRVYGLQAAARIRVHNLGEIAYRRRHRKDPS